MQPEQQDQLEQQEQQEQLEQLEQQEQQEQPEQPGQAVTDVFLGIDQSIGNNDFLGLGTSSADFLRNTIVVPRDSIITSLTFNIRSEVLAVGQTATAQIFINNDCGTTAPVATTVIATITGTGTPNCCVTVAADLPVSACTLLSVQVRKTQGAFQEGVAATILFDLV